LFALCNYRPAEGGWGWWAAGWVAASSKLPDPLGVGCLACIQAENFARIRVLKRFLACIQAVNGDNF